MSLLDIINKTKKNMFTVTVKKKKKKKKKKKNGPLGWDFLISNFNRLFSPDYASAAQVLYLLGPNIGSEVFIKGK